MHGCGWVKRGSSIVKRSTTPLSKFESSVLVSCSLPGKVACCSGRKTERTSFGAYNFSPRPAQIRCCDQSTLIKCEKCRKRASFSGIKYLFESDRVVRLRRRKVVNSAERSVSHDIFTCSEVSSGRPPQLLSIPDCRRSFCRTFILT